MARSYLPSLFGRDDDPFGSLFREVQKTFEDFSRRSPLAGLSSEMLAPRIDIAESKDAIDLTAELPGVDEKDVDVTLADGVLTIRGEKKAERDEKDKDKNWHVVERSYGSFSRTISLPFDPDSAKVEAKFEKGVLHIHLPKPGGGQEAAKNRGQKSLKRHKFNFRDQVATNRGLIWSRDSIRRLEAGRRGGVRDYYSVSPSSYDARRCCVH
jgi:HSP20 family protein